MVIHIQQTSFTARNYDYGRGGDSKEYAGFGWYGGAATDGNAYGYAYGESIFS